MGSPICLKEDALGRVRVLTPSSEGSLNNRGDGSLAGSRKRKRDEDTMAELLEDSFVVKPYPSTIFTKPQSLRPVALLQRADLPLSSLDLNPTTGSLPVSRLYEATVKILELEHRLGSKPVVLLVQSEDDKSHYAIEWESRGLYAVCKLGSWVDIGQLCRRAVLSRSRAQSSHSKSADVSSRNAAQERRVTAEEHIYGKRKRLAIEALQSVMKRPIKEVRPSSDGLASGGISSDIPEATSEEHIISTSVQNMLATGSAPVMEGNAQAGHIPGESATALTTTPQEIIPVTTTMEGAVSVSTAAEILENVRVQYFEALYLSKASLAYFAKGPLSRARASFHLDYDSALDMNDLISFLQSLILPIGVVDKKYKDAIPGLLSNYVAGSGDADDVQEHTGQPSKKTKTKKVKLCKDGLYTGEQDYIRKWWHSHSVSAGLSAPGQTQESLRRERISQLRTRETQLQMIVVLETLALQPLASNPADANESLPTIENGSTTPVTKPAPPRKSKKLPALNILLEMQADRLCIWQSVAAETDTTVSKGEKGESSAGRSEATAGRNGSRADMLRDFCVEVIMPFFSARLHEVCGMITLKLGGPVVVSPNSKTPARPSKSAGAAARPGSAAKRVISTKPARTLERVLTDDRLQRRGRSPAAAISLMRSATAPAIPGLKRERSEAPKLDSIPIADNVAINASRGGVLKSKKFSQREVDLGAMVAGADMRSKKPNIEAELKEAISALKRPNRQLAGQLMAESFERRAALASSNIRKSKPPVRNPVIAGVQILSTPKANRYKEVGHNNHSQPAAEATPFDEPDPIRSPSQPRIPLSVVRPSTHAKIPAVNSGSAEAQILSTPQSNRYRDSMTSWDAELETEVHPYEELGAIRSPTMQRIPLSVIKPGNTYGVEATPPRKPVLMTPAGACQPLATIEATPCRKPAPAPRNGLFN